MGFACTNAASCPAPVVVSVEGANQLVQGTATGPGGAASTSVTINLDKTAPIVTATPSPGANANGWNAGPVQVTFGAVDALSGVAPGSLTAPVTLVNDGANQSVAGQAADLAGNVGTVSRSGINIDQTKPTIGVELIPPANASGWSRTPVAAHFTCVERSLHRQRLVRRIRDISSEGANHAVNGTAADLAGNTASASATVNLDTTPPAFALTFPTNGAVVSASPITVTGTATDVLSGLATASCNGIPATVTGTGLNCPVPLIGGSNSIPVVLTDVAGNTSTSTLSVFLQQIPGPKVTITSPANLGYFNITPTTVTGTVDDAAATVTVNSITAPVVNGTFSLALPLAEGPNIVTATGTNATGSSTASVTVTLDTAAPHLTITSPQDGFVTTDLAVSIAGIVNDIVVGTVNDQQAQVKVNGVNDAGGQSDLPVDRRAVVAGAEHHPGRGDGIRSATPPRRPSR